MRPERWTRREYAKLLVAMPAAPMLAAQHATSKIANDAIELRFSSASGKLESKTFLNKVSGEQIVVPTTEFVLDFGAGASLSSSQSELKTARQEGDTLTFTYEGPQKVGVQVTYQAPAGKAYIRKRVFVCSRGESKRLFRVQLETWAGVKRNWVSTNPDKLPYGSHPIHCETVWAGVEFPAAFNDYGADGFTLASRPGGRKIGKQWVEQRSTVFGICEVGKARPAFIRYIEDVRHAPPRMIACYNSWWTLPLDITRQDALQLMSQLKSDMHEKTGTFFDIVTTDAGWNNRQSIWEIDSHNMPNGFADLKAIVEPLGAKLGLWMSPSEIYGGNCDWEWARKAGYSVIDPFPNQKNHGISLADPEYRRRTVSQLKKLITDQGFYQIKYDGFIAVEQKAHHELLPGEDSVEPLVEDALELLSASYEARPDLLTEPTFLNSWVNFLTPWMICYGDSMWANAGGDCPPGLGPAPAYREASTTAREFFVFSSLEEIWLPQNALQYFDIIQCDDAAGFANHVAMAVGRGRFFLSTYINPKFMRPEDWQLYAGFVRWAKKNQKLLEHTQALPSRVELGEPYAYGHWEDHRGVVVVRNPSNSTATYYLDLARSGAPKDLKDAVCYSIYPHRTGLRADLSGTDTVKVVLGPWQLSYLEIVPAVGIKEPVVIGGRWFSSGGAIRVTSTTEATETLLIEPGGSKRQLALSKRLAPSTPGAVTQFRSRLLPGPEWLSEKDKMYPSAAFDFTCEMTSPERAATKLLVLVEFPGLEHRPSGCKMLLDGRDLTLERSDSSGHIGYHAAKDGSYWNAIIPHQSHWTWYMADIPPGQRTIRISGDAGHPSPRIGVWAWIDSDLTAQSVPADFASTQPELPQLNASIERHGFCLRQPS